MKAASPSRPDAAGTAGILAFCLLACLISWLFWAPLALGRLGLIPSASPYLHLIGGLGPAIAVMLVMAAKGTLRPFLARVFRFPADWRPWAFALGGPALLLAAGCVADRLLLGSWPPLGNVARSPEYPALGAGALLVAEVIFYGFGEEIGWRGFLLPVLANRTGLLKASFLVGLPWAFWHLPLFLFSSGYAGMDMFLVAGWLFSLVTGSLLMSWLWRLGGGSVIPLALFHGLLDLAMAKDTVGQQGVAAMGVLITLWGLVALGALRKS